MNGHANFTKGLPTYCVRWQGYTKDDDSWLHEDDLQYVSLILICNYILISLAGMPVLSLRHFGWNGHLK